MKKDSGDGARAGGVVIDAATGQVKDEWTLVTEVLGDESIRIVFIAGPPGTGKTMASYTIGVEPEDVYAVTLTEDTSAAELRGHFVFKGGDAVFHYGPFVRALMEGKRLVINEISNASPDVLALLFPILESERTASLTLPTGETVRPAPGYRCIATDNRSFDELPEALQDRFVANLRVTKPHPDALAALPEWLRDVAEKSLSLDDERRISARGWNNLNELLPRYGLFDACRIVFGPDRGKLVHDAIALAKAQQNLF